MKKSLSLCLLLLLVQLGLSAQQLPRDNSYRTGKLENGLTYYIRHNAKEPGLADFYIAQRVGSILEEPQQRGLAHFLEHMAFNGTEHFRGDGKSPSIVPWCESIGVKFGANLNAYTSVDQTVYNISAVPLRREGIIDSTLLILHDWSHSLLLTDKEIDKERGVIHEEWRTRRADQARQRMMERLLPALYKGSKYEDCLPIGSMDIVDHFPYQDLRDYYRKWYRPDLQAIIVVGDVDVEQVEQKIRKLFGRIPAAKNPAERHYYPVPDNAEMIVAADRDPEQPIMLVDLYMKRDATPDSQKDSEQYLRDGYLDELVSYMLNLRLQELQRQAVPPALSASARAGSFLISRTKDAFTLAFGCRQENIRGSFQAIVGEAERARRHGFTAKTVIARKYERNGTESTERRNRYFVQRALQHFLSSEPLISAVDEQAIINKVSQGVTLQEVNAHTRDLISDRNQVLAIYAPDKPSFVLPALDTLKQYVLDAQQADYKPYEDKTARQSLMAKQPKAGSILSEHACKRFPGVTEMMLSNGVHVVVKPTQFAKDQVSLQFFGEGGTQLFPDSDQPNFPFVANIVAQGGVADMDALTLRKLLAGKSVKLSPAVDDDSQSLNGSGAASDLETLLQLLHLYFTQPRRDNVAFQGELNRLYSFYTNREANPKVGYNDTLVQIVYGGSKRAQPVKKSTLQYVSYDRILDIYRTLFSNARGFTLVLVGNIDLDKLRPLLCQYVASLPAGEKPLMEGRKVYPYPDIVNADRTVRFKKKMETPSVLTNIIYTFQEPFTPKSDLVVDMLKRCLQIAYTDSVREEHGGVYGVSLSAGVSKDTKPTTMLRITFRTGPEKYEQVIPVIYRQVENIAKYGPKAQDLEKVRLYLKKNHEQNVTDNGYWMYVLSSKHRDGIDYETGYDALLQSITAADLQKMAQDLLAAKRRIEVTMESE